MLRTAGSGLPWQQQAGSDSGSSVEPSGPHGLVGRMAEEVLVFSREHRGDRPGKSTLCLQSDGRFAQTIESLTSDAGNPHKHFLDLLLAQKCSWG